MGKKITTRTEEEDSGSKGGKYYSPPMVNIFVIVILVATTYLLYFTKSGIFQTWARGLIYGGIVIAIVYGATFLFRMRRSKIRDIVFIIFSCGITVLMMNSTVQSAMQNTISLELIPFGLADTHTGTIVLAAYWFLIPLIAGFIVGIYAIIMYVVRKTHLQLEL